MSAAMTRVVRVGVILIVAALVPGLFVLIAGQNPWRVLATLLLYAFGPQGWSEVLVHAIPLTLIGLGVAFALRAGLFNIGADGQLIAGAVLAVFFAPYFAGWGIAGLIVFLILGSIGGAALGSLGRLPAGLVRRQRDHRHHHAELRHDSDDQLSHPRSDAGNLAVLAAVVSHSGRLHFAGHRPGHAASCRFVRRSC